LKTGITWIRKSAKWKGRKWLARKRKRERTLAKAPKYSETRSSPTSSSGSKNAVWNVSHCLKIIRHCWARNLEIFFQKPQSSTAAGDEIYNCSGYPEILKFLVAVSFSALWWQNVIFRQVRGDCLCSKSSPFFVSYIGISLYARWWRYQLLGSGTPHGFLSNTTAGFTVLPWGASRMVPKRRRSERTLSVRIGQ